MILYLPIKQILTSSSGPTLHPMCCTIFPLYMQSSTELYSKQNVNVYTVLEHQVSDPKSHILITNFLPKCQTLGRLKEPTNLDEYKSIRRKKKVWVEVSKPNPRWLAITFSFSIFYFPILSTALGYPRGFYPNTNQVQSCFANLFQNSLVS